MYTQRTGLVTDSRARTISGWFGEALVLRRDGGTLIRENTCHRIKPLFGWYLCKFKGYRKVDCSFAGYTFVGYRK